MQAASGFRPTWFPLVAFFQRHHRFGVVAVPPHVHALDPQRRALAGGFHRAGAHVEATRHQSNFLCVSAMKSTLRA
jgi:hypothetical protein